MIAIIIGAMWLGEFIPVDFKVFSYRISLVLKEFLIFILPFMIFSFVFTSMVRLKSNSLKFILILIPLVCFSNFFSTSLSFIIGKPLITLNSFELITLKPENGLQPLFDFKLPRIIANELALLLGFLFGIGASFLNRKSFYTLSEKIYLVNNVVLSLFSKIIPIFILGFVLKLEQDNVLDLIIQNYLKVFIIVGLSVFTYILTMYWILSSMKYVKWLNFLRNMLPAAITGFSTSSSAAAMPYTIIGAKANISQKEIAESVIPATVNIHLVGDCFFIPITALAILVSYNLSLPDFSVFFIFTIYFVLAKFAVAAVPGGGILVMLPVIEQYLGFTPEMLSLITALYVIFDPIITSANVMGNGAFALCFARIFSIINSRNSSDESITNMANRTQQP